MRKHRSFFRVLSRIFFAGGSIFLIVGILLSAVISPALASGSELAGRESRLLNPPTGPTQVPGGSFVEFNGGCDGNCTSARAQVCNTGAADMKSAVSWALFYADSGVPYDRSLVASGTVGPLNVGQCTYLEEAVSAFGSYVFRVEQETNEPNGVYNWSGICTIGTECLAPSQTVVTPIITPHGTSTFTPTPIVATKTNTPVADTATPTDTPTNTPVVNTATPTDTPTSTPVVNTATPTDTPTSTPVVNTATPTDTPTSTPVGSTATPTNTPTNTPVVNTSTPTNTPTNTPVSNTATPTNTPTNTPVSNTATPTNTPTNTPVASTPTPTNTPTNTPVPSTATPTNTPAVSQPLPVDLTAVCAYTNDTTHTWVVTNTTGSTVGFTWKSVETGETGTGLVTAGGSYTFTTSSASRTVEVRVGGKLVDSATSAPACLTPLTLGYICTNNTEEWYVTNPNTYAMNYTFTFGNGATGGGVVPANTTHLFAVMPVEIQTVNFIWADAGVGERSLNVTVQPAASCYPSGTVPTQNPTLQTIVPTQTVTPGPTLAVPVQPTQGAGAPPLIPITGADLRALELSFQAGLVGGILINSGLFLLGLGLALAAVTRSFRR